MSAFDILVLSNALIIGLLVGSFLNVVIYRLPNMLYAGWRNECREFLAEQEGKTLDPQEKEVYNLAFPRSHCPKCKAMVKAWQNIPIISYLILKGKCYNCKTPISIRYPIVELLTGCLTAFMIFKFGMGYEGYLATILTWCLIVLTLIDIDHQLLPDNITLPLLWLGLLANSFGVFTDLESALYGAAGGYLFLWSIYWGFKLITGKEGMGAGDFKLLAVFGAWLGWQYLPTIILLSSVVGAVIGIGAIAIKNKDKDQRIPFGPYLAIAGWITLIWGDQILDSYIQFLAA